MTKKSSEVYIIFHFVKNYLGSGEKRQDFLVTDTKEIIPDLVEELAPTTFPNSPFVNEERRALYSHNLPDRYWSYETLPMVVEVK